MNRITYFSIALLIAFFLPWFNLGLFTVSGFDCPTSLDQFSNISNIFNNEEDHNLNYTYIFYLIPIVSVINLIGDYNKKNRNKLFNEFSIGLLISILIIYILLDKSMYVFKVLSIGFYMTIILSLIGLFFILQKSKKKNQIEIVKKNTFTEIEVKKDLFNQIEKLHKLNTEGVITYDVFNFEKNSLLKKIEEINLSFVDKKNLEEIIVASENDKEDELIFSDYKSIFVLFILIVIISISYYHKYFNPS